MKASEYLAQAIERRTGIVPRRGLFPTPFNPGAGAVRYLQAGTDRTGSLDGPSNPLHRFFEIECAAPTAEGAETMADDILDELRPHLVEVYTREDVVGTSQQRGNYFGHAIGLSLPDTVED